MRGKGNNPKMVGYKTRITPAYAGKRAITLAQFIIERDHPRVCGEKLRWGLALEYGIRITPAYAGKRQMAFVSANNF